MLLRDVECGPWLSPVTLTSTDQPQHPHCAKRVEDWSPVMCRLQMAWQ